MNNAVVGSFALYDEQHEDVNLTQLKPSIAHIMRALPKINRFNGHTALPYDVAMHSVQCAISAKQVYGIEKPHLLLAVLMHDAAEAYISDIPRPLKRAFCPEIGQLEARVQLNILSSIFIIHPVHMEEIYSKNFVETLAEIDLRMACTEYDFLGETKLLEKVPRLTPPKDFYVTDWRKSTYSFCRLLHKYTTSPLSEAPRFRDESAFIEAARTIISGVKGSQKYFL